MPFKSKAQEAFMYSKHPGIAARWSKETKNEKSLPEHVKKNSPWMHMGKKKGE